MPVRGLVRHRFAAVSLSLVLLAEAGAVAPPTAAHSGSPAVDPTPQPLSAPRSPEPTAQPEPPVAVGPETRDAPVELPAKRTLDSRTFLNPDGTYTTQVFGSPIHFAASDGSLQPIEPEAVAGRSEGVAFETKSGPVRVELGTSSAGPDLMSVSADGATVSIRAATTADAPGIQNPAERSPSADGRQVTYADVYPDVDLRYTLLDLGVKEDIVLKTPEAATSFVWVMETPGLDAVLQSDGSILIGSRNNPVFIIPAPFMNEAKARYPNLKGLQCHHIWPTRLMGGPTNYPRVQIPWSYHQMITNAFATEMRGIDRATLTTARIQGIMNRVYSKYPIPPSRFPLCR